jgi:hypothetical protein
MDGVIGFPLTIVADLPGELGVRFDVWDSLGNPVVSNAVGSALNDTRHMVVVDPERVTVPGLWRAEARGSVLRVAMELVIGSPIPGALPLWTVVEQVASHYGEVAEGRIEATDQLGSRITVPDLAYGDGYWVGRHLTIHPEDDLGNGLFSRRIIEVTGSTLVLSDPFPGAPLVGARCAVLPIPVPEIMRTLAVSLAEYGRLGRIPVTVADQTIENGEARIPYGLTHVAEVWVDGTRLRDEQWTLLPGRRLKVTASGRLVTFKGFMPQYLPALPTGWIVVEPTTIMAHAGVHIHSARSGGPGIDVEEHMRRMVLLGQLAEGHVARLAGRVPHGAREVIP